MGVLLIEAYFAFNYSSVREFATSTQTRVNELNMTSSVEPMLGFTLNAQREMVYNATKPILNEASSF